MPVQRFRSVEEMSAAAVLDRGDGFERFARHCARWFKIARRAYPRGVFRFRSIEEAQAARARVSDSRPAAGSPGTSDSAPGS